MKFASNQTLRAVLELWATLYRSDFSAGCPHFAYIYAIVVTMTASKWRKECYRVLVDDTRVYLSLVIT